MLVPVLPARSSFDIGKLEKLTPRVSKTAGFEHRDRMAAGHVELAISGIGNGLQDPATGREMGAGCSPRWSRD